MRIGIVLISDGIGGTEKRLAALFQYLARQRRHQYYLVVSDRMLQSLRRQQILTDDSLEIHRFELGRWHSALRRLPGTYYTGFPVWRYGLARALRRANAHAATDVFHYGIPASYLMAPREFRRHAVMEAQGSENDWLRLATGRAGARAGCIVNCLTPLIYDAMRAGVEPAVKVRFHASPGSVLTAKIGDSQQPKPQPPVIAFVARLEPIKNPLLFVDAMARLAQRTGEFRVSICGEGRLSAAVKAAIAGYGLTGRVHLSYHDHPLEVLAETSVFVSLQTSDNYPSQALLEAMASGCATVASDVGMTGRLVTPDTGLRVPFDPQAIADAAWSLISNRDRIAAMGRAARELVYRDHSMPAYARYVEGLYGLAAVSHGADRDQ